MSMRIKHGTPAGYSAELRQGRKTCKRCRAAVNEKQRARAERMERLKKRCSVRGCQKRQNAKGFCFSHYQKNRLHGDPLYKAPPPPPRPIKHGTKSGAQTELRRGLPICDDCLAARRIADSRWKREQYKPPPSEYAKRQIAARARHQRALAALRDEFREEYEQLLATEKRRRKTKHLTLDGKKWRARTLLAANHPGRFEELKNR